MNVSGMIATDGKAPVYFGKVASSVDFKDATVSVAAKILLYVYAAPQHGVNQTTVVERGQWFNNNHSLIYNGVRYDASDVEF